MIIKQVNFKLSSQVHADLIGLKIKEKIISEFERLHGPGYQALITPRDMGFTLLMQY